MNTCLSCGAPTAASLCYLCIADRELYPSLYQDLVADSTLLDELTKERNQVSQEFRINRNGDFYRDLKYRYKRKSREERRRKILQAVRRK